MGSVHAGRMLFRASLPWGDLFIRAHGVFLGWTAALGSTAMEMAKKQAIVERIQVYGFIEQKGYETNTSFDSPVSGNRSGRGGDRRSTHYTLTMDMAKELAMVERNRGVIAIPSCSGIHA